MVNSGILLLKGFGCDLYGGIGAAYNQFNGGNTTVWGKDTYTIEDKLVANRKDNYFSFTARLGLSVGFGK